MPQNLFSALFSAGTILTTLLRVPMLDTALVGPCTCSTTSTPVPLSEDHLLTCRALGVATWRHNDLRRTMRGMAMAAGFSVEEEPWRLPGFGQGGSDLLVHQHSDSLEWPMWQ